MIDDGDDIRPSCECAASCSQSLHVITSLGQENAEIIAYYPAAGTTWKLPETGGYE